ncbi:MAG: ABC transporter ATP-binding protein [Candidatus Marinimicrobia bacterium]|nr:ABC transporter ATP-binding protein [Candidatus Neomarinimicrobiota bacterium]MBL7022744.1 ABC transporter ATP-binding protein [Candidatus Neomarinimicrobiota bacterium]MBL7109617.1 ABC transporter ATP-binding protein [Candidatus Neomarinimicrobiota bacterium]
MKLIAKNITKSYITQAGKVDVLTGIDLNVKEGEIVAVMGPSGAGKSTLLHVIGTLDSFDNGHLEIDGQIISNNQNELSKIRATKLGFVFQFHHLLPEFTVLENLIIPQMLLHSDHKKAEMRAMELLNLVNLSNRSMHYPSQISGGEKQRVSVLRALVNRPKIIIADEPTGNLDVENSNLLLHLISELSRKFKQSFVIATHDKSVAEIANRTLVLDNGKLNHKKIG